MKIRRWKIYLGLLIVLIVALTLITQRKKTPDKVVKEIEPEYGNIQSVISTTGTVQPQNRLEVKPPISGRVEEILVREGEKVKTGHILAWMSSTERAALLDAAMSQGEDALRYWQDVYRPTPLIAPIDGDVIVRAVEPGQTVTSGEAVIVLSDRLIVNAIVDETDIGKVKIGQAAIVSLDAYPQRKVKAGVDHISYESKVVNNVTTYAVDILTQEIPEFFRSGMSANIDIIEESKENVLLLPLDAVKEDKDGSYVLLSKGKNSKIVKQRVKIGITNENKAEIISGVRIEDKIIIETPKYVRPKTADSGRNPFAPFPGRRR